MAYSSASARVTDGVFRSGLARRLFDLRLDTEHNNRGKITQEELAGRLNGVLPKNGKPISKKMISSWETGATEPGLREIAGLAEVFNTTCDYLITEIDAPRVDATRRYGLSNKALKALEDWNANPGVYSGIDASGGRNIKSTHFISRMLMSKDIRRIAEAVIRHSFETMMYGVKAGLEIYFPKPKVQATPGQLREKEAVEAIVATNPEFKDKRIVSYRDYYESQSFALDRMWKKLLDELVADTTDSYYAEEFPIKRRRTPGNQQDL